MCCTRERVCGALSWWLGVPTARTLQGLAVSVVASMRFAVSVVASMQLAVSVVASMRLIVSVVASMQLGVGVVAGLRVAGIAAAVMSRRHVLATSRLWHAGRTVARQGHRGTNAGTSRFNFVRLERLECVVGVSHRIVLPGRVRN